jgi:hypothetical protein
MESFKVGDVIHCPDCGLELIVTKACTCGTDCVIKCGDKPLQLKGTAKPGGSCCCGG